MKKVNILGAEYDIIMADYMERRELIENSGVTDKSTRTIVVSKSPLPNTNPCDDWEYITRQTIRHEIVHAFFFESGLSEMGIDEELVEWIACQFPKMQKAMQEAGGLD